jgi:hypothetical protein
MPVDPVKVTKPSYSKNQSNRDWYNEQLKKGYKPTVNLTDQQLEDRLKVGKYLEFYDPSKYAAEPNGTDNAFTAIDGTIVNPEFIKYTPKAPKGVIPKTPPPAIDPNRKPIEFTPGYSIDPNANTFTGYDVNAKPTKIATEEPIKNGVINKKNGGLVGKVKGYKDGSYVEYDENGVPVPPQTQTTQGQGIPTTQTQNPTWQQRNAGGINTGVNAVSGVGLMAGQYVDANNNPNELGKIDEKKATLSGGLKGAATGAKLGASVGSIIPGVGTVIGGAAGALIGGGIGAITGNKKADKANDEIDAQIAEQEAAKDKYNQEQKRRDAFSQREMGFAKGGVIKGKGTGTSDSIDAKVTAGSFIVPAKNADAAKEISKKVLKAPSIKKADLNHAGGERVKLSNGEIMFTPEEVEKIESELGEDYLDKLAPDAMKAEDKLEGETNENESSEKEMNKGGRLSKAKAAEILHDGTVHGKPITDQQRKYFGWVSSGGRDKACGGTVKKMATGGEVGIDDDEKFINDKRKALDALKNELDIAASKKAKTEEEKRLAENKKIAYQAAKERFDNSVKEFQKAKEGYKKYEEALKTDKYSGGTSANLGKLKAELDNVDKLRKKVKENADVIEKSNTSIKKETSPNNWEQAYRATKEVPSKTGAEALKIEPQAASDVLSKPALKAPSAKTVAKVVEAKQAAPVASAMDAKIAAEGDTTNAELTDLARYGATQTPPQQSGLAGAVNQDITTNGELDNALADATARNTTDPKTDYGNSLSKGLSGLVDYGLPLAQAGIGLAYLNKAGKRPVGQIDPDYLAGIESSRGVVNEAQKRAQYGFTPEEQLILDQRNQGLLNQGRYAARNYSGGSGGNAYAGERLAINDSFNRGLSAKVAGQNLRLEKQQYADAKQTELNNMLANKAGLSRQLFGDQMSAWQQNQLAGSQLVGAGIENAIGAGRYRKELDMYNDRKDKYNV